MSESLRFSPRSSPPRPRAGSTRFSRSRGGIEGKPTAGLELRLRHPWTTRRSFGRPIVRQTRRLPIAPEAFTAEEAGPAPCRERRHGLLESILAALATLAFGLGWAAYELEQPLPAVDWDPGYADGRTTALMGQAASAPTAANRGSEIDRWLDEPMTAQRRDDVPGLERWKP